MANPKNTARSKRKYGEKRRSATERNRANRRERADLRAAILMERTRSLLGKKVIARTADGLTEGKVKTVLFASDEDYPLTKIVKTQIRNHAPVEKTVKTRRGARLEIEANHKVYLVHRSSVKPA